MSDVSEAQPDYFLETKDYRQFVEFCDSCREQKTIGVCVGRPGVGKTEAAKRYAQWSLVEQNLTSKRLVRAEALAHCSTLMFLPNVSISASKLKSELASLRNRFDDAIERAISWTSPADWQSAWRAKHIDLIIIDEAYRLRYEALEELRDLQETWRIAVVLIGDPGMDRRLDRQPHFAHRVGFLHQYHQLSLEDATRYMSYKVEQLQVPGLTNDVCSAIFWYTQGNFRMLNTLFMQIGRLLKINEMSEVTRELVDAAREIVLFGYRPVANTAK